jgi:hypothetical protein
MYSGSSIIRTLVIEISSCPDSFGSYATKYFPLKLLLQYIIIIIIIIIIIVYFRRSILALRNFTLALSDDLCILSVPMNFHSVVRIPG